MAKGETIRLWWQYATHEQPLICVYCDKETSGKEDEEHILPEALGNKKTLYRGAVCKDCNNKLGVNVDSKMFHEPMMAAGQVATGAQGKKGVRTKIGKHVSKTDSGVVIDGGTCGKPNEFVIARAVAKCGVNIFTHYFGSVCTKENYPNMVGYVIQPKNKNDVWPFAAIYTPTGGFGITYGIETIAANDAYYPVFVFASSSGVFASVPDRHILNGPELAYRSIKATVESFIKKSGKEISRFGYVTR